MPREIFVQDGVEWVDLRKIARFCGTRADALTALAREGGVHCLERDGPLHIPMGVANRMRREAQFMKALARKSSIGDTLGRFRGGPIAAHRERKTDLAGFAAAQGLGAGVTGYMVHSVAIATYAWLAHYGDYDATVAGVIALGGDTDSVASFAGALAGGSVGLMGIPPAWREGILDWPRREAVWLGVADRLATLTGGPVAYPWPLLALRNALLLGTVLAHGVRRLAPPYG